MRLYYVIIVLLILLATGLFFFNSSEKLLEDSIATGDLETVQKLLDKNPKLVNATIGRSAKGRHSNQISALCLALQSRQPEIARELLLAGAYPTKNTGRINLLSYPAREGYVDLIPLLITKGVDPNIEKQPSVYLPLACPKDVETAQVLLDNGADLNARNADGQTPLHGLATFGDIKIALLLIENGADVNAEDNKGMTALTYALKNHDLLLFKILMESGAKE